MLWIVCIVFGVLWNLLQSAKNQYCDGLLSNHVIMTG